MKFAPKRTLSLFVIALGLPLAAWADVTYTYTGPNYTHVDANDYVFYRPPEENAANTARLEQALLASSMSISITLPVFLRPGWNAFNFLELISPELVADFTTLQDTHVVADPTLSYAATSFGANAYGAVTLQGWAGGNSVFVGAIHVDANGAVDDWNISALNLGAGDTLSSNGGGDTIDYQITGHGSEYRYHADAAAGSWAVSGNAVSAVPEPAGYAMLAAGLGLIGLIARRRRPSRRAASA